ncbi:unnamed protein product, partial [Heterosigma akashiwo]
AAGAEAAGGLQRGEGQRGVQGADRGAHRPAGGRRRGRVRRAAGDLPGGGPGERAAGGHPGGDAPRKDPRAGVPDPRQGGRGPGVRGAGGGAGRAPAAG